MILTTIHKRLTAQGPITFCRDDPTFSIHASKHRWNRCPDQLWRHRNHRLAAALAAPPASAQNTPSLLEFRWDDNSGYRKLYFVQSSQRQRERAEYMFMLRPKDRKTAILKLSISVPKHFNARIRPKNLSLCKMKLGGMLSRSRCEEVIPAVIEVNEDQTAIEVFPDPRSPQATPTPW